jgi:hypothetical protein
MRVRAVAAAAALPALVLAGAACGSDDDGGADGGDRQELVDSMVSEGATEDQARCFVDELGDDAERLYTAADAELSEEDLSRIAEAFRTCDPEGATTGGS